MTDKTIAVEDEMDEIEEAVVVGADELREAARREVSGDHNGHDLDREGSGTRRCSMTIRALWMQPGKPTSEIELDGEPDFKWLQEKVGGYIELIPYPTNEPGQLYVDEDGRRKRLSVNDEASRLLVMFYPILGNAVFIQGAGHHVIDSVNTICHDPAMVLGRPKLDLPPEERKVARNIRVSGRLWNDVMQRAAVNGLTITGWITQAIMEKAMREDAEYAKMAWPRKKSPTKSAKKKKVAR